MVRAVPREAAVQAHGLAVPLNHPITANLTINYILRFLHI